MVDDQLSVEKNERKSSGNLTQFSTSLKDRRVGSVTLESVIKPARRTGGHHSIITVCKMNSSGP